MKAMESICAWHETPENNAALHRIQGLENTAYINRNNPKIVREYAKKIADAKKNITHGICPDCLVEERRGIG